MWYHQKESQWTSARYEMCRNGSHRGLYINYATSLDWLAIIEDLFQTSPRFPSQSLSFWRHEPSMSSAKLVMKHFRYEEAANHITGASAGWHRQVFRRVLWCLQHQTGMCPYARRASDCSLLATTETPRGTLPYSWSWVSSSGVRIEDMATLFAWECGSHLHGPQELEVYLHTTRPEHEAVRMAQVDQRLRAGTALSSGQGQCSCGRTESQGSLQLFTGCSSYWRRVQNLSATWFIAAQHRTHTPMKGRGCCHTKEWWRYDTPKEKNGWHGIQCTDWDCGWFGKVPHVQIGMVDGLERCMPRVQLGLWKV
jgi:hypothetical protein